MMVWRSLQSYRKPLWCQVATTLHPLCRQCKSRVLWDWSFWNPWHPWDEGTIQQFLLTEAKAHYGLDWGCAVYSLFFFLPEAAWMMSTHTLWTGCLVQRQKTYNRKLWAWEADLAMTDCTRLETVSSWLSEVFMSSVLVSDFFYG